MLQKVAHAVGTETAASGPAAEHRAAREDAAPARDANLNLPGSKGPAPKESVGRRSATQPHGPASPPDQAPKVRPGQAFGGRAPNSALPTRTQVEPSAMAA